MSESSLAIAITPENSTQRVHAEKPLDIGLHHQNPDVVDKKHEEKPHTPDTGLGAKVTDVAQLTSTNQASSQASPPSNSATQTASPTLPSNASQAAASISQLPLLSQPAFPGAFPIHQLQILQHASNQGQGQPPGGNLVVGEGLLDPDAGRYLHQQALQQLLGGSLKQKLPTKNDGSVSGSAAGGVASPMVDPLKKKGRGGKRAGAGRKRKRQDAPPGQAMPTGVPTTDGGSLLSSPSQVLSQTVNNVPNLSPAASYSKISSPQAPVSPRAAAATPSQAILGSQEEEAALKTLLSSVATFQQNIQKYSKENPLPPSNLSSTPEPNSPNSKQRRQDELQKYEEQNRDLDQRLKECFQLLQGNASLNLNLNNKIKALEAHVKELQAALQEKEESEKVLLQQKRELEAELALLKKIDKQ